MTRRQRDPDLGGIRRSIRPARRSDTAVPYDPDLGGLRHILRPHPTSPVGRSAAFMPPQRIRRWPCLPVILLAAAPGLAAAAGLLAGWWLT
jgi:hypothetical protein